MKAFKEHAIITSIIICILGAILFIWPGGTLQREYPGGKRIGKRQYV